MQTQYTFEPFGATTTSGATSSNAAQFTGRENDGTGLYAYRARNYSPRLHRFVSEDPLGLTGGVNVFVYAANAPTVYTDPFGLKPSPGFGQPPGGPREDLVGRAVQEDLVGQADQAPVRMAVAPEVIRVAATHLIEIRAGETASLSSIDSSGTSGTQIELCPEWSLLLASPLDWAQERRRDSF